MAEIDAIAVLRQGLLEGVSLVLAHAAAAGSAAGPSEGSVAATVGATCSALGAVVHDCALICGGRPEADDAEVDRLLAAAPGGAGGVRMLVVDAGGLFALLARAHADERESGATADGRAADVSEALIATLEASWRVTRAVANAAFIPDAAGGRIVYVAPSTQASGGEAHADAARAGLENLARTLSIEWARYGITPVTIAPGPQTMPEELAGVVAYLASPAGDYFSGCQLGLRGLAEGARSGGDFSAR